MGHLSCLTVVSSIDFLLPFLIMEVIETGFQTDGSLHCLSEVSNMTLSCSHTLDESSLSSLVCIYFQSMRVSGLQCWDLLVVAVYPLHCSCLGSVHKSRSDNVVCMLV